MFFILLGAPGAGKGTQADIIVKEMSLPHVASGDLFRHALEERDRTGQAGRILHESRQTGAG